MEVELPWMLYWVIGLGSLGSLMSGAIRIYNSRSTRALRYAQAAEAWSRADRHHSKAYKTTIEVAGMKAKQEAAQTEARVGRTAQIDRLLQQIKELLS